MAGDGLLNRASDATPARKALVDQPMVFVCVRRLVRRTGVLELVEAFLQASAMGRLHPDTVLHIAGDGPLLPEIRLLVAQKPSNARLILHGQISDEARLHLYRESDLNVVPTQALEGFGLVVIEAALQGCPSLVTDVGGLPEVLALLDHIGVICRPDVASLSEALLKLRPFPLRDRQQLAQVAARRFLHPPSA
jgi:glycosyltransferase involved in cell wall biosynthesis